MKYATGVDDPALSETTWPLPDDDVAQTINRLAWNEATVDDRRRACAIMQAYVSLICDGATEQQVKRLAALRRVWRRSRK